MNGVIDEQGVAFVRSRRIAITALPWAALGLLVGLGLSGCAEVPPIPKGTAKKVPVSGFLTMDGQPVEGAEVYFYTEKFTGFGTTNAEGKFRLKEGAAIGPNKVYFSKLEGWNAVRSPSNDPVYALNDPGQEKAAALSTDSATDVPKQLIPGVYNDPTTTPLKFDVPEEGATNADFKL